jgi:acetylornithine/succinyldiaminopimelate/putrescine aminotransferase
MGTISNRELFLRNLAQTSTTPLNIEIDRAKGIFMYSPEGKRYFDLISGVNVSSLGHGHPSVIEAVKKQLDQYMHLLVYGELVQSPQVRLAELLVDNLSEKLNKVYFVNSGTEAIEGALKLARKFTGRPEVAAFTNAYHGSTAGALSIMGGDYFKSGYYPIVPGTRFLKFNNAHDLNKINEKTACVVAEVMQAEAGMIEAENDFLLKLRNRCDQTGTLLIFDEVQTAFGRLGTFFGHHLYNVTPDILVLAKGLGGGMPLGAFVSSSDIMQVLSDNPPLGHITTFGGHPVCCAAGLETLSVILKERLFEKVIQKEKLFRKLLKHKSIREIRGKGLMLALDFGDADMMHKIHNQGLELGFISDWFLFCETSLRISPALSISDDEITEVCQLILKAIDSSE